ncbi:uncharacterized protein LOC133205107 [Saccostrea echinata]|uniref:uncharacterized protein LOC133205107 n=1 Tax=Saccostrea echinata TaxID=191078 RepID=UPI002A83C111|nr:uncharacterized protein LOC133205107 [Saccostrea echinata]
MTESRNIPLFESTTEPYSRSLQGILLVHMNLLVEFEEEDYEAKDNDKFNPDNEVEIPTGRIDGILSTNTNSTKMEQSLYIQTKKKFSVKMKEIKSVAQRLRIQNRRSPHPVPAFRYNPHHNRGHSRNRFSHSQSVIPKRQDSSREIFQTHPGQRLSPTTVDAKRQSIFRFQGRGQHGIDGRPFNSVEHNTNLSPPISGRLRNHVPKKSFHPTPHFHATPHKISKPQFSFLSAMNTNFQGTTPLKKSPQNFVSLPARKWIPPTPTFSRAETSGPTFLNSVHNRQRLQPTYVDKRPRQIHQRRFTSPLKITMGIQTDQGGLVSPPIPNMLPENIVIANAQANSDIVKTDMNLMKPAFETKFSQDKFKAIEGTLQTATSSKPINTIVKSVTKAKPLQKKVKKVKSVPEKVKNKKNRKQKTAKTTKSKKSKALKKKNVKQSKIKSKKNNKTTPTPVTHALTKLPKTTKAPTTTEKPDDDLLFPGGSSGSWDVDRDFTNSGSQEVMDSFGRDRFLPGCHCTMFCRHGFEFAGFCGASSAEFFRPRLSKCCPVRNGSDGSSRQLPFFFDD